MSFDIVKISQLPVAGGVSDSDELVINQSGITSRIRKDTFESALNVSAASGVVISTIEVTDAEELTATAGNLLVMIVVVGSGAVKVGTTEGGGEILDDTIGGTHIVYNTQTYFVTSQTLYLTCDNPATFKLYFL